MTQTERLLEALEATKNINSWAELDSLNLANALGPVFKKNIYLKKLCNMLEDIKARSEGTFNGFDALFNWYKENLRLTVYCHKVSTGEIVTI